MARLFADPSGRTRQERLNQSSVSLRSLRLLVCALFLSSTATLSSGKLAFAQPKDAATEGVAPLNAEQAQRANSIAKNTMSPFCPGRTLADCPSPNATEWREDIRTWIAEGAGPEEIRKRLEQRIGGQDLSGTPSTGLGWGLPVLLAVLAIAILAVLLRRLSARQAAQTTERAEPEAPENASAPERSSHDDELERRLARELEREDL